MTHKLKISIAAASAIMLLATAAPVGGRAAAATAEAGCGSTGRYTIIHSPEVESDTMLLDTQTGKTWQLVQVKDGGPLEWQPVDKITP
jgi:hypothetical protein